ncbi:MAG: phage minor head protein [Plesiomonas sp.]|uniref:phage head morphogenesis protein n=1 Tax=Plesiomonas sp. TaxID=2486279 RepID=UPI003F3FDD2C
MPTHEKVDLAYAIGLPPAEAVAYLESKGYAIGLHWYDVYAEAHAKAFTVAGVMKLDVLRDIQDELLKALAEGRVQSEFEQLLLPILERKVWLGKGLVIDKSTGELLGKRLMPRRLDTIFRTNMQSAYNAGRYREQKANAAHRPFLERVAIMDGHTRPKHAVLNGFVAPIDSPVWGFLYPPDGYGCRCRVRARSAADVDKYNLTVHNPEVIEIDQEFGIPGETSKVPAMVNPMTGTVYAADSGFGINPGQVTWQPELDKYATLAARQYITATLTGPDFAAGYAKANAGTLDAAQYYPVAMHAQPINGSRVVRVSGQALRTMVTQSSPVLPADFLLAQQAIQSPTQHTVRAESDWYCLARDDVWWVAQVKEGALQTLNRGASLASLLPEA